MKRLFAVTIVFLAGYSSFANAAEEEAPPAKTDKRAAQRLEVMRGAIDDFVIVVPDAPETALKFSPRPLLRYNDQTRKVGGPIQGVLDATVWRLGETGRPKAIITLEIYLVNQGSPLLTYEFASLTPRKLDMQSARGVRWMPHSTDLSMTELDGQAQMPAPAGTPPARLVQMRELARRFTASELLRQEKISLRLLPQPLDRYSDADAGILDGAVFVFANGTNPEMGLLLECSDKRWSYGLFRLASVPLFLRFDDQQIDVVAKPKGYPVDAPYTATRHPVFLPEEEEK